MQFLWKYVILLLQHVLKMPENKSHETETSELVQKGYEFTGFLTYAVDWLWAIVKENHVWFYLVTIFIISWL